MRASTSGRSGSRSELLWPLADALARCRRGARPRWLGAELGARQPRGALPPRRRPQKRQRGSAQRGGDPRTDSRRPRGRPAAPRVARRQPPPSLVWGVSNALYVVAPCVARRRPHLKADACWSGGNHLHAHYRACARGGVWMPGVRALRDDGDGARRPRVPGGPVASRSGRGDHRGDRARRTEPPQSRARRAMSSSPSSGTDATPLIRYRVGDRATSPADTCVLLRARPARLRQGRRPHAGLPPNGSGRARQPGAGHRRRSSGDGIGDRRPGDPEQRSAHHGPARAAGRSRRRGRPRAGRGSPRRARRAAGPSRGGAGRADPAHPRRQAAHDRRGRLSRDIVAGC